MENATKPDELDSQRIDGLAPTFAAIWVAAVGVIAYMFLPLLLGGLADDLGFTNKQLGFIGAAEAGGMGIANAVAIYWIRRSNWRLIIYASVALMVAANMASITISTFPLMFVARLVDGFAGGSLIALGVACQSDNSNADRVFGYFVASEMLFSSLGFLVLPSVSVRYGVDGIFVALAVISASVAAVAFVHPTHGKSTRTEQNRAKTSRSTSTIWFIALAGALLFFMSQGGLWAFVERIAIASSLTSVQIGQALAVSSLFGIAGALGANWVSKKLGQFRAFVLVLAGEILCISILYGELSIGRYFAATGLFILFWSMGLPLMLSQFNRLDESGRLVVLLYAMGKLGYTLGPAVMGLLIFGTNFTYVLLLTVVLCAAGLGVSIWLADRDRRNQLPVG